MTDQPPAVDRLRPEDLELVDVAKLHRHPENPRRGDVGAIRDSIREHGVVDAIVAQRSTGAILGGNHRWEAALAEGATRVPVIWVDVTDDEALEILLVLNRTADRAGYDNRTLARLLTSIQETGRPLAAAGWDEDSVASFVARVARAEAPPVEFPDVTRPETEYRCPECRYEWSGAPRPRLPGDEDPES